MRTEISRDAKAKRGFRKDFVRKPEGKGRVKGYGDCVGKISSSVSKLKLYNRVESKLEQD
ncbi:hypothetical protein Gotur_023790 [Gossypium turneri]